MKEKKAPQYKVTLDTCGVTYTKQAESIDLALEKMNLSWNDIKGKGVIRVEEGDKSFERLFNTVKLRRIFGSKMVRLLWSGRLRYLLK